MGNDSNCSSWLNEKHSSTVLQHTVYFSWQLHGVPLRHGINGTKAQILLLHCLFKLTNEHQSTSLLCQLPKMFSAIRARYIRSIIKIAMHSRTVDKCHAKRQTHASNRSCGPPWRKRACIVYGKVTRRGNIRR